MTFSQWEKAFPDEDACDAYLVAHRWPQGTRCPRCNSDRVYSLQTRKWHWECPDCRQGGAYRFSDITGTIFENTKVDLRQWFRVIHLMLTSKKGISALQIQRMMGFGSYRTAWYMCHRVRAALVDPEFRKLMGIVEVDETYIGGKNKNRHADKKIKDARGTTGKLIVIGAASRKGNVVARVIENTDTATLDGFVREAVSEKVSLLATDEHSGYRKLGDLFAHEFVRHGRGEYVNGAVHTQTIDGFWSLLKRGIMGSYHKISRKYLPLYVAEFTWRYNNRDNPDIFEAAIAAC
ncbi:MAG: IS1595 family transposase [Beijerinckiaceae bacterium]